MKMSFSHCKDLFLCFESFKLLQVPKLTWFASSFEGKEYYPEHQWNSTAYKAPILHDSALYSIPSTLYGPPSTARSDPRAQSGVCPE